MRANASGLRLNLTTGWRDKSVITGSTNYANRSMNDFIIVKIIERFLRRPLYERSMITYSHLSLVRDANASTKFTLFVYDGNLEDLIGKLKYLKNLPLPPWPRRRRLHLRKQNLKKPLRLLFFKQRKNLIVRRYIRYRLHQLLYIHVIRNLVNNIYYCLGKLVSLNIALLWTKNLTSFSIGRYLVNHLRRHFRLPKLLYPLIKRLIRVKNIRGIRVECSGRFNRKQRASSQIFKKGKVAISELGSLVSYRLDTVRLKYGLCGLKVWLSRRKVV